MTMTPLKEEVVKTLYLLLDLDLRIYGKITEGTKEAFRVQEVELPEVKL